MIFISVLAWCVASIELRGQGAAEYQPVADAVSVLLSEISEIETRPQVISLTWGTSLSGAAAPSAVSAESTALGHVKQGSVTFGSIRLSSSVGDHGDGRHLASYVRHELAHQWLLANCPRASEDRLFHELIAMAVAGEGRIDPAVSVPSFDVAVKRLLAGVDLDSRPGRSALRRVLVDEPVYRLPLLAERLLRRCHGAREWMALTVSDLVSSSPREPGAVLLLDRQALSVVWQEGDIDRQRPVGSTLKPFVVAGAAQTPTLMSRQGAAEWACGKAMPSRLTADQALARSCNGYFLDWQAQQSKPNLTLGFGAALPWLKRSGLTGEVHDVRDAIGLTRALRMSPRQLAMAYVELAQRSPNTLRALEHTTIDGTLQGESISPWFSAAKTGTVRTVDGVVEQAWIVLVGQKYVLVSVRAGLTPKNTVRSALASVERALAAAR